MQFCSLLKGGKGIYKPTHKKATAVKQKGNQSEKRKKRRFYETTQKKSKNGKK
jgi:hypothetical protein